MNPPPLPLVGSGRRLPGAGPGRQPRRPAFSLRLAAGVVVLGLTVTLMLSPAVVAVLVMTLASRFEQPGLQAIGPSHLVAFLESGRALLTLALVPGVMQATEQE